MSNIWRVVLKGHHSNGTLVQPSLHYQTDLSIGEPNSEEPEGAVVAEKVWAHIGAHYKAATSDDITVDEVVALEEVRPPALGGSGSVTVNEPGTYPLAGGGLPHALVPVINLHTATRSRSARGWLMLGAPRRYVDIANDNWDQTTALWSAWQTLCDDLSDDVDTGGLFPVVIHPVVFSRTRFLANNPPWTFNVIDATVQPQCRWLRSRLSSP